MSTGVPLVLRCRIAAIALLVSGCAGDAGDGAATTADLQQWLRTAQLAASRAAPRQATAEPAMPPSLPAPSPDDFGDSADPFASSNIALAYRRGEPARNSADIADTGRPAPGLPRMVGTLQRAGKRYALLQTGVGLRAVATGEMLADGPYRVQRIGTVSAELQSGQGDGGDAGVSSLHIDMQGTAK